MTTLTQVPTLSDSHMRVTEHSTVGKRESHVVSFKRSDSCNSIKQSKQSNQKKDRNNVMVSLMLFEERTDEVSAKMKTTSGECTDRVCPVQQTVPNSETISDSFSDRTGEKRTTISSLGITEQSRTTVSKSFLISSLLNALDVPEQDNTYKQNQLLKTGGKSIK
ncbi:hypothetical protein PHET_06592 [Paragonimus heterotremus]|uniref:Uncharacterized protein n=1 Tax=Paragonimus heterotremus TaxID=100268 RepID=A0A8J4WYF4_9TREM|nr:hypothetical protein PHET_06592 [Paragonimus heterotremus]